MHFSLSFHWLLDFWSHISCCANQFIGTEWYIKNPRVKSWWPGSESEAVENCWISSVESGSMPGWFSPVSSISTGLLFGVSLLHLIPDCTTDMQNALERNGLKLEFISKHIDCTETESQKVQMSKMSTQWPCFWFQLDFSLWLWLKFLYLDAAKTKRFSHKGWSSMSDSTF